MAYQVVLADSAKADAKRIHDWVVEQAPTRCPAWFEDLVDRLNSLETLPNRCPLAREAGTIRRPVRCLSFGKSRHVCRIPYEVEQSRKTVWILHIRHCAMRDFLIDLSSGTSEEE